MSRAKTIAGRFREVILNGKWIANTNFRQALSDVAWEQANRQVGDLNTIAALTFHIGYYIGGVLEVFEGGPLAIRDKYSFDFPPIESQADWERLQASLWERSERFAEAVERMSDEQLDAGFVDEKYGTYERNIEGIIEHSYYHLGQVILLKKLLNQSSSRP